MAAVMQSSWGRLVIPGSDGADDLVFGLDKRHTFIGRDQKCDIRIINREVSRKHVQLEVNEETGQVVLSSIGREPVSVNGEEARDPVELSSGDQIEVHLEGQSRLLIFEADGGDETLVLPRNPLREQDLNRTGPITIGSSIVVGKKVQSAKKRSKTPKSVSKRPAGAPPPPPPPPPGALLNRAAASRNAPPPPPAPGALLNRGGRVPATAPRQAKTAAAPPNRPAMPGRLDPLELQNALKVGLAGLKKATAAPSKKKATPKGAKKAAFVPDSEELQKLRSRLRKTFDEPPDSGTKSYCDFMGKGKSPAARRASLKAAAAIANASCPAPKRNAANNAAAAEEAAAEDADMIEEAATEEIDAPANVVAAMEVEAPAAPAATAELQEVAAAEELDIGATPRASRPAKKRKTVRFSLPLAVFSSPEGVPADATGTFELPRYSSPGNVVQVDADNTMAISAWAMGSSSGSDADASSLGSDSPAAAPSPAAAAQAAPALPHIPEARRRRSSSRLRHSSTTSDLGLATIAEENNTAAANTPEGTPTVVAGRGRRSLSSRPGTPAVHKALPLLPPSAQDPAAANSARKRARSEPPEANNTPTELLRFAAGRRSTGAVAHVRFSSPVCANQPNTPNCTPVTTGRRSSGRISTPGGAANNAAALAARLREVAAQQDLTIEMPPDFFASPQADLMMRVTPPMQQRAAAAVASPAEDHAIFTVAHAQGTPQQSASGEQNGGTPSLSLRVPLACLPSPDPSHITLRIPKEVLEAAGRAGTAAAGARQLTLAVAEALGAMPVDDARDAAAMLAAVEDAAKRQVHDARIAARQAINKMQRMATQLAAAEKKAAKLAGKHQTLAKLLAREHAKRIAAEEALAGIAASIAEPVAGHADASPVVLQAIAALPGPITSPDAGPPAAVTSPNGRRRSVVVTADAHIQEAPGPAHKLAAADVRPGGTPVRAERLAARVATATAPTPILPRWPFLSPQRSRRVAQPATATVEEVPAWLFCGAPVDEEELALIAQDIDETASAVKEALGGAQEPAPQPPAADDAAAAAAVAMEIEEAAAEEQLVRGIVVEVAAPAEQQQGVGDSHTAPAEAAAEAEVANATQQAQDAAGDKELCTVCGQQSGKKVMLLCDGCDAPTHLACTQPRLRRVPKGDWFCPTCTSARASADEDEPAAKVNVAEPAVPEAAKPAPRGRSARKSAVAKAVAVEGQQETEGAEPEAAQPLPRGRAARKSVVPKAAAAKVMQQADEAEAGTTEASDANGAAEEAAKPAPRGRGRAAVTRKSMPARSAAAAQPEVQEVEEQEAAATKPNARGRGGKRATMAGPIQEEAAPAAKRTRRATEQLASPTAAAPPARATRKSMAPARADPAPAARASRAAATTKATATTTRSTRSRK